MTTTTTNKRSIDDHIMVSPEEEQRLLEAHRAYIASLQLPPAEKSKRFADGMPANILEGVYSQKEYHD